MTPEESDRLTNLYIFRTRFFKQRVLRSRSYNSKCFLYGLSHCLSLGNRHCGVDAGPKPIYLELYNQHIALTYGITMVRKIFLRLAILSIFSDLNLLRDPLIILSVLSRN